MSDEEIVFSQGTTSEDMIAFIFLKVNIDDLW